jgi:hypothetical protein
MINLYRLLGTESWHAGRAVSNAAEAAALLARNGSEGVDELSGDRLARRSDVSSRAEWESARDSAARGHDQSGGSGSGQGEGA